MTVGGYLWRPYALSLRSEVRRARADDGHKINSAKGLESGICDRQAPIDIHSLSNNVYFCIPWVHPRCSDLSFE